MPSKVTNLVKRCYTNLTGENNFALAA